VGEHDYHKKNPESVHEGKPFCYRLEHHSGDVFPVCQVEEEEGEEYGNPDSELEEIELEFAGFSNPAGYGFFRVLFQFFPLHCLLLCWLVNLDRSVI